MAQESTTVAPSAGKGERKERKPRGPKGEGKREGGKGGRGEGGKGGERKERKPRKEIPTFDDPEAELAKLGPEPVKANRDSLDRKIGAIQNVIDGNKRRTEQITKDLDAIKEKNERLKANGSGPLEKSREVLRDLKKQIVGVIEERKSVSAQIDNIREKKQSQDEQIKKQKAAIGRFTTNEAIDEEIRRIEDHMAHNTMGLKQEKAFMIEIKELNKKRDEVKLLEQMEGKRSVGGGKVMSLPELFEARKVVDGKLDVLRTQEKAAVEQMNAIRDKTQDRSSSERFEKLLEERKKLRDEIGDKIAEIRVLRNEFQEVDDKWYEYDRMVKNLKWQIRQVNLKKREEEQKKWEEEKAARGEEWAKEQEHKKNFDEDGNPREKFIDFDLAERIALCGQLTTFLKTYVPKEDVEAEAKDVVKDGRTVEAPTDVTAFKRDTLAGDDPLGLNAFAVDEVVSKRSKKQKKKKQSNLLKWNDEAMVAAGDVVPLSLSIEMLQQFSSMNLAVPVDSSDAAASITSLAEKKAYYEKAGEEGKTLKDLIKEEKDAKKPKKEEKAEKKTEKKAEKKEEKKEEKAAPAAEAEPKKEAGRDFAAEKMARKVADMPDVDPDIDLAALRAKAKAGASGQTEEEKKARGLLYDTSKASALREESEDEDDEGACDMEGGDPFEGL